MKEIKKKGRIIEPKACTLIGVVDPFGVLQPGEIHLRIKSDSYRSNTDLDYYEEQDRELKHGTKIKLCEWITGPVIVTKNPCVHPGDIRYLKAARYEALKSLVNVIVFPQVGEYPEQLKMAGGDLDGDVYFCTWNTEITDLFKNG